MNDFEKVSEDYYRLSGTAKVEYHKVTINILGRVWEYEISGNELKFVETYNVEEYRVYEQ